MEHQENEVLKEDIQKKQGNGFVRELFSWIKIFVVAIVIAVVINEFVIINANVPTGSMQNTIQINDRMIGLRVSYWFHSPKRGDIVIFNNPEYKEGISKEDSKLYVKRAIGLPGEKITIKDAKIYINDSETPLKEDYLKEEWYVNAGTDDGVNYNNGELTYHVPKKGDKVEVKDGKKYLDGNEILLKDCYLENSGVEDGEKQIPDGVYTVKADCYFVIGDNRNDSWDARYWGNTNYVSEDDILAQAVLGYYPWRGLYKKADYAK